MHSSKEGRKKSASQEAPSTTRRSRTSRSGAKAPGSTGTLTTVQLPDELWAAHRRDHDENEEGETLGVCVSQRDAAVVALNAALECAQERAAKLFDSTDTGAKPVTRAQAFSWLLKGMPVMVIDRNNADSDDGEYHEYVAFCIATTKLVLDPQPVRVFRVHVTESYSDTVDVIAEGPGEASEIAEGMINCGEFNPSDNGDSYGRNVDDVTELEPDDI